MITVIHPSIRPDKSLKTMLKWIKGLAIDPYVEWILSLDEHDCYPDGAQDGDPIQYARPFACVKQIRNKNRSAVDAINNAAKIATYNIMMVVSDDTDPCDDWQKKIIEICKGKNDFIIKTQDGIQPWIITMPIMDRTYYNRFGYIYHPGYQHMFCDTELTCVADITGRRIESNLLFPHKHYSVTKEQPDAINRKADATWDQGEKLFLERYKRNFDLPPGGKIQDKGMINWLQRKVR